MRKIKWVRNALTRMMKQGRPVITYGEGGGTPLYSENPIPAENDLTPALAADWDLRTALTSGANLGFTRETS